ncbi:MBL fold metallo-hydrolase [Neobacillus sp. NPDC093182]|uniref:MBL fold metallo-hydrolase n=1 Tax=Neobacillus sp. NPDC093182 TaxID=3364297 RepID=UPI00381FDABB
MIIQRLDWAGVLIETENNRILIDPVYKSPEASFFGKPKHVFSPLEELSSANAILITHLHSDHFDPDFIIERFGVDIPVFVANGNEKGVREKGLSNVKGMSVGEVYSFGELSAAASYSVDGLGDNQVSWVVTDSVKTIIHCGDTLWHGYWWEMERKYGPFDAAFLPINGAAVNEPGIRHSKQPICLTPEQAVSAARVLNSKLLIPIHYRTFHHPPIYMETENAEARLLSAAKQENIKVQLLQPKEILEI